MVYHLFQKSLTAFFGFCGVFLILIFFLLVGLLGFFFVGEGVCLKKKSTRKLKIAMALTEIEFEESRL